MSQANQATLETYNKGVWQYINGTAQETDGDQKLWLDKVFAGVPLEAKILEIGSAFGREAKYLTSKGYQVVMTDGSAGFVEYLRERGESAELLDIINETPRDQYDVILACAVFLHFDDEDFNRAARNVQVSLRAGGQFAFSVKRGVGEQWLEKKMGSPRYFHYWDEASLPERLAQAGMRMANIQTSSDEKWLHVVAESDVDEEVYG